MILQNQYWYFGMEQKSKLLDSEVDILEYQSNRIFDLEMLHFRYKILFDNISKEYPEIILKYHHIITEIEELSLIEL